MRAKQRILVLEKKIEQIQRRLNHHLFDPERSTLCVNDLIDWVKCSAVGHDFKLKEVYVSDYDSRRDRCIVGYFRCESCGLKIERTLTDKETKVARQLGMI